MSNKDLLDLTKDSNNYLRNQSERRYKRGKKNNDHDITHKIRVDIPILDGTCNIQSQLNVEVHEKPVIQISEDFSVESTVKFQSCIDVLNDHIHEAIKVLSTLLYGMLIKPIISLTHPLQNFRKKIHSQIMFTYVFTNLLSIYKKQ